MADLIEFGGPEASKRFCPLALPHMLKAADGEGDKDTRLQSAAAAGLGIAAQFGGKLLSRSATADAARKLAAMAQARPNPNPHPSPNPSPNPNPKRSWRPWRRRPTRAAPSTRTGRRAPCWASAGCSSTGWPTSRGRASPRRLGLGLG